MSHTALTTSCLACSRLRDSGEKWFSKKKCEKRAAPFPKSRASYFRFARFNTSALYYLRAWHRLHPVRLFGSLPRRRSFGSSRNPLQRTTFVRQECVTNPKDRLPGRWGGGGLSFLKFMLALKVWSLEKPFVKEQLAIIEFGFLRYEECCRSRRVLSAEVDNTLRDQQNSSYTTKAEFNNCFIIPSK